ncbi:hypothetical protein ACVIIV_005094 [Bradyrhizobium sp. USDA 4354]
MLIAQIVKITLIHDGKATFAIHLVVSDDSHACRPELTEPFTARSNHQRF